MLSIHSICSILYTQTYICTYTYTTYTHSKEEVMKSSGGKEGKAQKEGIGGEARGWK